MVVDIANRFVHRILLDSDIEVNVIYKSCWDQMDLEDKVLKRSSTPIVGFSGEAVQAEGKITLPVTIKDKQGVNITIPQEFYIIDAPTRYNYILERKFTVAITDISSTHHQTLFFVGKDGRLGRARGNQKMARTCNFMNKASTEPQK